MKRRVDLFGMMILGVAVCMAACGKKNAADGTNGGLAGDGAFREWVYAAERIEIPDRGVDYTQVRLVGDTACYIVGDEMEEVVVNDSEDTEGGAAGGEDTDGGAAGGKDAAGKGRICRYSLADRELKKMQIVWEDDGASHQLGCYTFDAEYNAYLVTYAYAADYSGFQTFLYRFDADGKTTLCREITDQFNWVTDMAVDSQGRIYLFDRWAGIWLYDAEGKSCGCIEWENSKDVQALGAVSTAEGKLYTCLRRDQSVEKSTLVEVDFTGKKVTDVAVDLPQMRGICSGGDGSICLFDETKVYRYSLADNKLEEVFPWSDGDVNGYCVYRMGGLPEEAFLCSVMDWASDENDVVILRKCKAEEVPARAELVLAVVKENDGNMGEYFSTKRMGQAVQLSRNSTKYHITIRKYDSLTSLYRALITGENIDLIDLSGTDNGIDVESLCRQGVFENLSPYLEKSDRLSEDSFVEGVLEAYYYGDQLVGIPDSFVLRTLAGDKGQLKNPKGLDLAEFYELSKSPEISKNPGASQNPEGKLLVESLDGVNRADMLRYLLLFNEESFIDWEKKECQFHTEAFRQILELAANFPEQAAEITMEDTPRWKMIEDGEVMFTMADLSRLKAFQMYEHAYGESAGFVGFPTPDGEGGTLLIAGDAFGITVKCGHKEEAWAFIEDFLCRQDLESTDPEELYSSYVSVYGRYPARKDILQCMADFRMAEDTKQGVSGGSMGRWGEPDYRVLTKEDIYAVMELLPYARPYSSEEGDEVLKIVSEEAGAYFAGQRTFEEVAELVQNRVKLYVQEQDFVQPRKRERPAKPFTLADNGNGLTLPETGGEDRDLTELVNPVIEEIAKARRVPFEEIAEAQPGDIVLFGSYEQDYDMENGKEPIEWYVLENAEGQVTLLSVYLLDYKSYEKTGGDTTWEECTLRAWLNRDFLTAAFTKEEQKRLVTTRLTNADNPVYGTEYGSKGGNDTEDQVWLLSLEDVERYFHVPLSALREEKEIRDEFDAKVIRMTSEELIYQEANLYMQERYKRYAYYYEQDYRTVALPTTYLLESYHAEIGWEFIRSFMKDDKVDVDPEFIQENDFRNYGYLIGTSMWWLRSPGREGGQVTYGDNPIPEYNGVYVDLRLGVRPVVKVSY